MKAPLAARLLAHAPHLSRDRAERIVAHLRDGIAQDRIPWASVAATARASAARRTGQAVRLLALVHPLEDALAEAGCRAR